MLTGAYQDLFPAIAECAAALTGLLFVAMTVAARHNPSDRPVVIQQVRAAASILAFTNALAVSLFGLVPGNNIGYPATVLAVIGILFTAAGTRSIFSSRLPRRHVPRQLGLTALLLATFAFELAGGIILILNPHSADAAGIVSNLLVALLVIGIARTWELVGDRDTGIIASIAILTGHNPDGPSAGRASRPGHDRTSKRPRTADPHRGGRPPGVSSTSPARGSSRRRSSRTAKHSDGDAVLRTGHDPRSASEVPHQRPRRDSRPRPAAAPK